MDENTIAEPISIALSTHEVRNITDSTAFFTGSVSFSGDISEDVAVWIAIGQDSTSLLTDGNRVRIGSVNYNQNEFSSTVSDLAPNTKYYYAFFISSSSSTQTSHIMSFVTRRRRILTSNVESIGRTKATIYGEVDLGLAKMEASYFGACISYGILVSYNPIITLENSYLFPASDIKDDYRFFSNAFGLLPSRTYYYAAFVDSDVTEPIIGEVLSFSTDAIDYKEVAADMGLSVEWAYGDVGGFYYWGETEETWELYGPRYELFENHDGNCPNKYTVHWYFSHPDNKTILDPEDDAATVHFGEAWRMPTKEECQELLSNCDTTWRHIANRNEVVLSSRITGESIVLYVGGDQRNPYSHSPVNNYAAYWSSSLVVDSMMSKYAWYMYVSPNVMEIREGDRAYHGFYVRPVRSHK